MKKLVIDGYNRRLKEDKGNEQVYSFHCRHINYKNTLGNFIEIDTTLFQNLTTKQWEQFKASYHCKIPEYSDDWFEFYNAFEGANHTIKAKPLADHIKGIYFNGEDGNGVIYKDAFGKGIDLKVYAYWGGLKKVIIINEKPADTSQDLTFDFELQLPVPSKDKVKDKEGNVWDKATKLDFKDKTLKIGEDGKESYFRNAMIWDSEKLRQPVDIELYVNSNKIYLRKTITKEILQSAVYPLYTDHPTSYYAGAGDGSVQRTSDFDWAGLHDTADGNLADYTSAYRDNIVSRLSPSRLIARAFFPIDTSGIGTGNTVTAAVLYVFLDQFSKYNADNDGDDWINVVQTNQADTSSLIVGDYDVCGDAVNNPTEGATRIDITSMTANTYIGWTLNATGRGWIDVTGVSKLGLREGHDCINSSISTGSLGDGGAFYTSAQTGTSKDPYLDVTVSAGATVPTRRRIMLSCN